MVDTENFLFSNELPAGVGLVECDTTAGLPSQFVKSMRTLFDLMDDNGSGEVALSEIERRWRDDAVPNLPGVLDALRAVAPVKGLLNFEHFVSGLGLALHRTRLKNHQNGSGAAKQNFGFQQQSIYGQPCDRSNLQRAPSNLCNRHTQQFRVQDVGLAARGVYDRSNSASYITQNEYHHNRSRFKHRRSNSGPIYIGKIFPDSNKPTPPHGIISADDSFVETNRIKPMSSKQELQLGTNVSRKIPPRLHDARYYYGSGNQRNMKVLSDATNIGSRSSPSGCDSPASDSAFQSLSQESTSSPVTNERRLNQAVGSNVPGDQLCGDNENGHVISVKPVLVSGKYIGITGTLQKTTASATAYKRYGSLPRRSAKSMATASYSHLPNRRSESTEDMCPTNSKSDFSETYPRKRSVPKRTNRCGGGTRSSHEESHARSISSTSPQDVPLEKLPRKVTTKNGIPLSEDSAMPRLTSGVNPTTETRRHRRGSHTSRRRSARWNTTGVTFNTVMFRQLKTIQQKEDLLRKGMATADEIRTVFLRALMGVEDEKTKLESEVDPSAAGPTKENGEANQLKRDQSTIANSVMAAMSSLERIVNDFQLLEISSKNVFSEAGSSFQSLNTMQEQNHRLSREVSEKSDVIRQLEQEKAALVRQLFQARSELQQCDGNQPNTSIFI